MTTFGTDIDISGFALRSCFATWSVAGLLAPGIDAAYAAVSTLAFWDGIQVQWLVEPKGISVVEYLRRHLAAITTVVELET